MSSNLILVADSYKTTHWLQLPRGIEYSYSTVEPRKASEQFKQIKKVVPFGITAAIKKMLLRPITTFDIMAAKKLIDAHMGPGIFNLDGWMYIVRNHGGYMPVVINAIPEGTVVPVGTPIVSITNTDPECAWLPSYLETFILHSIWYPTTVASLSAQIKENIQAFLRETSDDQDAINFMLHDFGYRGVSSDESGSIGGLAHLINFKGTDTIGALVAAIEYYDAAEMPGFSVIASEHSTQCTNSDAENRDDFAAVENMVRILEDRVKETGQFQIVSCVADTYDVYRFTREYVGERLRDRIMNSGGRFVVRPDSGDALTIPIELVQILMEKFGYTVNSKGYKVLPPCIRVLQGDGINMDSITKIMGRATAAGLSVENFVFGMGGALLQGVNRDSLGFAMKASSVVIQGKQKDIFKDPITDPNKKSKKGVQHVYRLPDGTIETHRAGNSPEWAKNMMVKYYENGLIFNDEPFEIIVKRAQETRNLF